MKNPRLTLCGGILMEIGGFFQAPKELSPHNDGHQKCHGSIRLAKRPKHLPCTVFYLNCADNINTNPYAKKGKLQIDFRSKYNPFKNDKLT